MRTSIIRNILIALLLLLIVEPSFAQRSRGGGGGGRRRPPAEAAPPQDPATPLTLEQSMSLGTVPDFRGISPDGKIELSQLSDKPGSGPVLPAKVIRYAGWFITKHDTNFDGILQFDEWRSMPGAPQAIDINGDTLITIDELLRHVALYGAKRSLHRPDPPASSLPNVAVSTHFQLFRPLSMALLPPESKKDEANGKPPETPQDVTDETLGSDDIIAPKTEGKPADEQQTAEVTPAGTDQPADPALAQGEQPTGGTPDESSGNINEDITFEAILEAKQGGKKYYRPLSDLKGVPAMFLIQDKNGDGQLSLVEFAPNLSSVSLALFAKLDTNKDNFVTPAEMIAGTKQ